MEKMILLAFLISVMSGNSFAKTYNLSSPDNKIRVNINVGDGISFTVHYSGKSVIESATIGLELQNSFHFGTEPKVRAKKFYEVNEEIYPVVPVKSKVVHNQYNSLVLIFRQPFKLEFRAYNDGVAYRIIGETNQTVTVQSETGIFDFPENTRVWFPQEDKFYSHFERMYLDTLLSSLDNGAFCSLPVLLETPNDMFIAICDSDVKDYPQMFLEKSQGNALKALFPPVVLETEPTQRPHAETITSEADYIAYTRGFRDFPWRAFILSDNPGDIVESNLIFALAGELEIENPSWIKPGKVAWDWWNANNIYGVDFRAGINTETYKHYIDFASRFRLEYIILDEGWSDPGDVMVINPDINLTEIINYGKEKNVGIILWVLWKPLDKVMEAFMDSCQVWGVKGLKIDFMQRADQEMVNYYWKTAEAAAAHQLILDFHGAYKPAGFNRTYPNILSHEGVKGLENNKWSMLITPRHDLTLPFTRMVGGPMDYTPGAMINAQPGDFHVSFTRPMSQGTRCHEIAKYVIFESPLQMLADSPSNYYRDEESTEFISRIPVTWDETKVLDAAVGEYIVMARKKGGKWYLGAMTNEKPRQFQIRPTFLDDGEYNLEIMQDGINADRNAMDYSKITRTISTDDTIHLNLAPGGGWVGIFE